MIIWLLLIKSIAIVLYNEDYDKIRFYFNLISMDIHNFLDKFSGDWFSQRTNYNLIENQVDNSKANVTIKFLPADDKQVVQLSQQHNLNQDLSLGAIASNWDNSPDWGKPKQQGNSLMLIFSDTNETNIGKLVRVVNLNKIIVGKYVLAEDESLTLTIEENNQSLEERITFSSDNLRIRNSIERNNNEVTHTTFYSEIRRVVSK